MDPTNSEEENHDSTDSTTLPTNDVKEDKSQNNEKARLRAKPDSELFIILHIMLTNVQKNLFLGYRLLRFNRNCSESLHLTYKQ